MSIPVKCAICGNDASAKACGTEVTLPFVGKKRLCPTHASDAFRAAMKFNEALHVAGIEPRQLAQVGGVIDGLSRIADALRGK